MSTIPRSILYQDLEQIEQRVVAHLSALTSSNVIDMLDALTRVDIAFSISGSHRKRIAAIARVRKVLAEVLP